MTPPGSTLWSGRASSAATPLPNHHGTPFIAGSTMLPGPISGASSGASAGRAGLFTARMMSSWGPSSRASSAASATGACSSVSSSRRRQPCSRSATSVVPRARADTALPAAARRVPRKPPIAPAPTTQIFTSFAAPAPASAHVQAAVERKVGAGGKGGVIAHQPVDDGGDFIRLAEALDRYRADNLLQALRLDGTHHVGPDVTRRDGVDRHAARCDFLGKSHGEAVDAGLGRRIVGLPELATLPVDRGNVDDASPATLDHAVDHLLGDVKEGVEVGLDDGVPCLVGHLLEGAVARDTGIVDQDIDGSHLGPHRLEGTLGRVPIRDVALGGVDVELLGAHFRQPAVLAR